MKTWTYWRILLGVLLLGVVVSCGRAATEVPAKPADEKKQAAPRGKESWAKRIVRKGCRNLHQVDDNLYRGAQPTVEGFHELKKLGIKTVVNLRRGNTDRQGIKETKLAYVQIPTKHYDATAEELILFLKIATDEKHTPVFVHCRSGANRTGMMVAIYRVAVNGWTKQEALKEMREGGYNSYGGGKAFDEYMKRLNVKALRRKAGLDKEEKEKDEKKEVEGKQ